jgi:hypothetical protein
VILMRRDASACQGCGRCRPGASAAGDGGGIWGYDHLLEVLADPNHPEYEDQSEWVEDDFDPEAFDMDRANIVIAARTR